MSSGGTAAVPQVKRMPSFVQLREAAGPAFIEPSRLTKIGLLGSGAFAEVNLCRLVTPGHPDKEVAVKRLFPSLYGHNQDVEDFVREGTLLASLHHPNIVNVLGLGFRPSDADGHHPPHSDSHYIVEEVCTGGSLSDKVVQQFESIFQAAYTSVQGVQWLASIAGALRFLHTEAPSLIIHRDIKLANILLFQGASKSDITSKLADFGLAKKIARKDNLKRTASLRERALAVRAETMTRVKEHTSMNHPESPVAVIGDEHKQAPEVGSNGLSQQLLAAEEKLSEAPQRSPSMVTRVKSSAGVKQSAPSSLYELTGNTGSYLHMAPEVMLGHRYNEKADIFSMGVVIYEVMSGAPFGMDVISTGAPAEYEAFALKVAGGFRRPNPPHWPEQLKALVSDCLAQDPHERPNAVQLEAKLKGLLDSGIAAGMDRHHHGGKGCCCCVQ
mmetsp:Transcript_3806/g.10944  ORF Transcript_3806/g.10944 Transcript_3806/m.10944 type:complete len:442 (+) Transcript_3806:459-1784(+)